MFTDDALAYLTYSLYQLGKALSFVINLGPGPFIYLW
jgi:hypothetical protein